MKKRCPWLIHSILQHGMNSTETKMDAIAPAFLDVESVGKLYYIVITTLQKKEHLIYSSPALGATGAPNGTPVSRPASNTVGAGQDVRPTSDKSSVPFMTNVAQGQEEVNDGDNI